MARANIINNIRKYLIDENIYTSKDELTLLLLETTYSQYQIAVKEVKAKGQTITTTYKGVEKTLRNPAFTNQLELQKQLFKLMDSLYLSPKSRRTKKENTTGNNSNPFLDMMNDIMEGK